MPLDMHPWLLRKGCMARPYIPFSFLYIGPDRLCFAGLHHMGR